MTTDCRSGTFAFSERKLDPSIFVHTFPELELKNELKGNTPLDYTSLTLSDGGPYLGSCSSLPDYSITVCVKPQTSIYFMGYVWCQSVGFWYESRCFRAKSFALYTVSRWTGCNLFGVQPLELPPNKLYPNKKDKMLIATHLVFKQPKAAPVTPSTVCWTATSQLCVGCAEGYLLLVDPESLSVSVLFDPKGKLNCTQIIINTRVIHLSGIVSSFFCFYIRQTWELERPVTTAVVSPNKDKLLLSANTVST
uniref:Cilia- and flagella-associated protein 43 n=1 Tax=Poecilia latipinna TaxID=48699 RepID=A0A3B3VJW6_9TELE